MANNVPQLFLFLRKGENETEALTKFVAFVKGTGGAEANVNADRDLFDQWRRDLNPDEVGVFFTRSSFGPSGVMAAKVITISAVMHMEPMVKITRNLQSQTNIPPP